MCHAKRSIVDNSNWPLQQASAMAAATSDVIAPTAFQGCFPVGLFVSHPAWTTEFPKSVILLASMIKLTLAGKGATAMARVGLGHRATQATSIRTQPSGPCAAFSLASSPLQRWSAVGDLQTSSRAAFAKSGSPCALCSLRCAQSRAS